jgi:hypothetical protein
MRELLLASMAMLGAAGFASVAYGQSPATPIAPLFQRIRFRVGLCQHHWLLHRSAPTTTIIARRRHCRASLATQRRGLSSCISTALWKAIFAIRLAR